MKKRDYIFKSGVLNTHDPEKIKLASLEYDRMYHREYMEAYRRTRKRLELYFPKSEYQVIKVMANDHELRVGEFIRLVLSEYQGKQTLIMHPGLVQKLIVELKRIGNNINQLAKFANTNKVFHKWEEMRIQLDQLETNLTMIITEESNIWKQSVKTEKSTIPTRHKLQSILSNVT